MHYQKLGTTNLSVSVLGFGGIPIQRGSQELATEVIQKAATLGINFIDTARAYTVSEAYIGHALKGSRQKWILASKSMARTKELMAKDVRLSCENLQTDYIDLYQLHNLKTEEELQQVLAPNGAYTALAEAKQAGRIGHIGVTAHSLDILKKALESGKFASIMYPYNIVESQGAPVFMRAQELGVGVIAMKPLAGGALPDSRLALKFILQNKAVTTAIPGMGDLQEVVENAAIANDLTALTETEQEKINQIIQELGTQFCRRCGYCGPCPEGIDIPTMFLLQGYKERYDLATWGEERYFSLPARAKHCVQCGACEKKCPYDLPIRKMLETVAETFPE